MDERSPVDAMITKEAASRRRQRVLYGTDAATIEAGARSMVLAIVWRHSVARRGVALIVHPTVFMAEFWGWTTRPIPGHYTPVEYQRERVDGQRAENARRDRATLEVCRLVLMGYVEGREHYARQLAKGFGDALVAALIVDHSAPGYFEMKMFLRGELDASEVVAATAAFAAMRYCNPQRIHLIYEAWEFGNVGHRHSSPFELPSRGWL